VKLDDNEKLTETLKNLEIGSKVDALKFEKGDKDYNLLLWSHAIVTDIVGDNIKVTFINDSAIYTTFITLKTFLKFKN